jgi:hypothetical protein
LPRAGGTNTCTICRTLIIQPMGAVCRLAPYADGRCTRLGAPPLCSSLSLTLGHNPAVNAPPRFDGAPSAAGQRGGHLYRPLRAGTVIQPVSCPIHSARAAFSFLFRSPMRTVPVSVPVHFYFLTTSRLRSVSLFHPIRTPHIIPHCNASHASTPPRNSAYASHAHPSLPQRRRPCVRVTMLLPASAYRTPEQARL